MADNVGYTPGSGATVAADEIGGVLFQRVKLTHGEDGSAIDASEANPLPVVTPNELLEAIQALRMAVHSLTRTIGMMTVDPTTARLRAEMTIAASQTLATVTTVSTVTTLSTMTNQSQIGGVSANTQIPNLLTLTGDNLRRNISVT